MRLSICAALLFAAATTSAQADNTKNFDFSKSPCASRAASFEKAVAIRVFPHLADQSILSLRDGKTDWEKSFGQIDTYTAFDYIARGTFDGWAVYQLHNAGDPSDGFKVQYMFGDVTGQAHDCVVVPDAPQPVAISEMPPVAIQMYLTRLTGDGSGTPRQMRDRLAKLQKLKTSAKAPDKLIQPPVPSSKPMGENDGGAVPPDTVPGPAPRSAPAASGADAPSIDNACGVPVASAIVEIGSHQPPKVFTPENVDGHVEFNYLREGQEPLTAMCFRKHSDDSIFRVPLPAGLSRCAFEDGKLACWSTERAAAAVNLSGSGPNLDFDKSPCHSAVGQSGPYVSARIYPVLDKDGRLKYFDAQDGSSWIKTFANLTPDKAVRLVDLGKADGWAIYQAIGANGEFKGFSARYLFGDLGDSTCLPIDETRPLLDVFDIPKVAVAAFLQGYGAKVPSDTMEMRSTLVKLLSEKAVTGGPPPASPVYKNDTDLPDAVFQSLKDFRRQCHEQQPPSVAVFSEDYVTIADIDGDGRHDYILNGDGAHCESNGKATTLPGNGGTTLTIYMDSAAGLAKTYNGFLQGARLLQFKGFAILDADGGPFKLRRGHLSRTNQIPKGGREIYVLAR